MDRLILALRGAIVPATPSIVRSAFTLHAGDDDWTQAGTLARDIMNDEQGVRDDGSRGS